MTDQAPKIEPPSQPRPRRSSKQHVNTARVMLDSSMFVPIDELSANCEVEAARAAALDLIDALANMQPTDPAREHVTAALRATTELLATHAGAASEWAPTGWWYEAKQLTAKAFDAMGTERTD